jgi:hypothetical protein
VDDVAALEGVVAVRVWIGIALLVCAAAGSAAFAAGAFSVGKDLDGHGRSRGFPARTAAGLIGAQDDISFRRALDLAAAEGPNLKAVLRRRSEAELLLADLMERARPALSGSAGNLFGLLELANAQIDREAARRRIDAARLAFQAAVRADPRNEEAKYNLELLLSIQQRQAKHARNNERPSRANRRAGYTPPGSGY